MKLLSVGLEGGTEKTVTLRKHVHIGRASYNGIVLDHESVCPSHAIVRVSGEKVVVEDLGSVGGTWVDDVRVDGPTPVSGPVRIGPYVVELQESELGPAPTIFLEELATGIRHSLGDGSFLIGDAKGADIHVPGARPLGIWLQQGVLTAGSRQLQIPWEGRLGGIVVRLVATQPGPRSEGAPLALQVRLQPPAAKVVEVTSGAEHTIRAPNRVALLYYLARAQLQDAADGVDEERMGWRSDENVAVAVWGRGGRTGSRNRLNTLTYRLRGELTEQGINTSIIEKMAGWMRIEPCSIEVEPTKF